MKHSKLTDPGSRTRQREALEAAITAMIAQPQFPCVGAKSALARDNLKVIAGHINPMLATYGESSEARQYSGRQVGDDWQCPFQDRRST